MNDSARARAEPGEPYGVVAIAASAGGISALGSLPGGFPVPVLVVQHLDPRHRTVIAEVLGRRAKLQVRLARDGEEAEAGTVYVAPPNYHRKRQLRDMALEAAPFAMIGVDAEGNVVLINSLMRAMFGMTARDVGRPFHDLEISYRPLELRSLIERAYAEHRVVRVNAVERPVSPSDVQYLDIHIQPLWGTDGLTAGVMVMFIDTSVVTRLQLEVKRDREDLDTAHEELQSTNEELETTNEELQSTNEELETTNEELQSGNEERSFLAGVLSSVAAWVVVRTPSCWSGAGTRGRRNCGACAPTRCATRRSSASTSGCRRRRCGTSCSSA